MPGILSRHLISMIGRDLDADGNIIDPVRANWVAGVCW